MSQTSLAVNRQDKTVFQIDGITCLDCAQKFEKAVGQLPGVMKASLNTMTGKLTIEGAADLRSIRRLGQEEGYTINPLGQQTSVSPPASAQANWELRRTVLSGLSLAIAFYL